MAYDAAIIGASADGLAAACLLARAGKRVLVVERSSDACGRLTSRQFHPGFHASVFSDAVAEIPDAVAALLPSLAAIPLAVPDSIRTRKAGALARAFADAAAPCRHGIVARLVRPLTPLPPAWPGSDLATAPLTDFSDLAPVLTARALDPQRPGSALALLALPCIAPSHGGLGSFGAAFLAAAKSAGAEIRLGLEASEVCLDHGRVQGVVLADGTRIAAEAVISTLDLKHSLMSLFPWNALAPQIVARAAAFRMAGGTARLLLALRTPPAIATPLWLPGDAQASGAWRRGAIPTAPPLLFDPVSQRDASLAPPGAAVATVTLGAIPCWLFDGAWTHQKRLTLAAGALARIEALRPGTVATILGLAIVAPPDIEEKLGLTDGDLDGGALAPDQMLDLRPGPRSAVRGLYLGGPSTAAGPLGTGAAGYAAAIALLADRTEPSWWQDMRQMWRMPQ